MKTPLKRHILLLTIITLAIFSNALFNGFAGDDGALIVKNDFYKSLDNFPKIFTKEFLVSNTLDYYGDRKTYNNSGAVSYRPIVSVSLFLDYWLWKLNPFGYHLHNILLHILCVIAVYFLALHFFTKNSTAFLGAILFALHPLKTEAVTAIGFRQDIQATLLILMSLILYIRYHSSGGKLSGTGSLICYFFALFSKEAAIVFPVILITFEYLKPIIHKSQEITPHKIIHHGFFWIITAFYLYIYLYVFPSTVLGSTQFMGSESYFYHLLHIPVIYAKYLLLTLLPNLVHSIPGLYYPTIKNFQIWHWFFINITIIGTIAGLLISIKNHKNITFLILWYILFYGPISNIIPLSNPMAFRFLYLPSVGSLLLLAWALEHLSEYIQKKSMRQSMANIIKWGFISLCAISTFTLNYDWKNNFALSKSWIKHYPKHPTGHKYLGLIYIDGRMEGNALTHFKKAIELNSDDPRAYFFTARYNGDLSFKEKEKLYKKALKMNPFYASAAEHLGHHYYKYKQYNNALTYYDYQLSLKPTYSTYRFMMLACNELKDEVRANLVLQHAQKYLEDKLELKVIEQLYTNKTMRPIEDK